METENGTFPAAIFCIIVYEFCERFSFCGLRTILSLYLRNELLFSENASTVIYHIFNMACHAVPLVGAFCADSFLGRYRTILYFTSVYLIGNIFMCITSIPSMKFSRMTMCVVSLVLLALGSGALKPCVAAFGGDQFRLPDQQGMLRHFFSIFYFTINLGGFMGMIVTPIIRKWVTCFGEDTCYSLGFGLPALLVAFGLIVLFLGKFWYRLRSPKGPIIKKFFECALHALAAKRKAKKKEAHWLDYARGEYNSKLIADMKVVSAILLLYTPLPLFWSLFDQQGSRWTFQASHMNGNVLGTQIVPDQMQVMNPVMVLFLIPLFDRVLYPILDNFNILCNPLHRMAIGGVIAGLAFLAAGILELVLEKSYPQSPDHHHSSINFVNTLPCSIKMYNVLNITENLRRSEMSSLKNIDVTNMSSLHINIVAPVQCGTIGLKEPGSLMQLIIPEEQVRTILVGVNRQNQITMYLTDPEIMMKSLSGRPRLRICYIKTSERLHNVTVVVKNGAANVEDVYFVHDKPRTNLADSAYMELIPGINEIIIHSNENRRLYEEMVHLEIGGIYTYVIREDETGIAFAKLYAIGPPNDINIMWLLPQYFLISVAEIMFGIAGLEFSFTQAPKSMKTVTIAGWYMSVAIGNLIVIIITQANLFKSQAYEFFLFAVLIVADMMIFAELASHYQFVSLEADSSVAFLGDNKLMEYEDRFWARYTFHHIFNYAVSVK